MKQQNEAGTVEERFGARPFYAVPCQDIVGFEAISAASKRLATFPEGYDPQTFQRRMHEDETFARHRAEVYARPNQREMLHREAGMAVRARVHAQNRTTQGAPPDDWEWRLTAQNVKWNPQSTRIQGLHAAVNAFFQADCRCVGDFLYSPGAYRSWHTNKFDGSGWVLFLSFVDVDHASSFRYLDPVSDELVVVPDAGLTASFFEIPAGRAFWHCVVSDGANRWSQGFALPSDWKHRVRLHDT